MINASINSIEQYFSNNNQYIIPFFQRAYVWAEENWEELWNDIIEIIETNSEKEHFIGTIIIKEIANKGDLEIRMFDLIDGQQRLTTICLLLKAINTLLEDQFAKKSVERVLFFADTFGKSHLRILHSKIDSPAFEQIIVSNSELISNSGENNRIIQCYNYFYTYLNNRYSQTDLINIKNVILKKLKTINFQLSDSDDVQQIFDRINSLGVRLKTSELLKNYLFSPPTPIDLYEDYWLNLFEANENEHNFWESKKTSGRKHLETIDHFLYCFLTILAGKKIKQDLLFKEFKEYLQGKATEDKKQFVHDLHTYAGIYRKFPIGQTVKEISYYDFEQRFFLVIEEFEITTIYPLVLFIYLKVPDQQERNKILNFIESYLLRRTVCKLSTKNYNNHFIKLMVDFSRFDHLTAKDVETEFLKYNEETNRFPQNIEFVQCFKDCLLTNKQSKLILGYIELFKISHDYNDSTVLNIKNFSVEHLMPKNWRANWRIEDSLNINESERDRLVLTIGNLTLIKGKFNSSLGDNAWGEKRQELLNFSSLIITRKCLERFNWNESEIINRTEEFANIAIQIWKSKITDEVSIERPSKAAKSKELIQNIDLQTANIIRKAYFEGMQIDDNYISKGDIKAISSFFNKPIGSLKHILNYRQHCVEKHDEMAKYMPVTEYLCAYSDGEIINANEEILSLGILNRKIAGKKLIPGRGPSVNYWYNYKLNT